MGKKMGRIQSIMPCSACVCSLGGDVLVMISRCCLSCSCSDGDTRPASRCSRSESARVRCTRRIAVGPVDLSEPEAATRHGRV